LKTLLFCLPPGERYLHAERWELKILMFCVSKEDDLLLGSKISLSLSLIHKHTHIHTHTNLSISIPIPESAGSYPNSIWPTNWKYIF
jgi:hypothetical protein